MVPPFSGGWRGPPGAQAVAGVAAQLAGLGHHVDDVTLPLGASWEAVVLANARIWWATLVGWIDGAAAATGRPIDATTLEPQTLAAYRYGRRVTGPAFAAALDVRNAVTRATATWFDDIDVLADANDAGPA